MRNTQDFHVTHCILFPNENDTSIFKWKTRRHMVSDLVWDGGFDYIKVTRSLWQDWSPTGLFLFYNLQKF